MIKRFHKQAGVVAAALVALSTGLAPGVALADQWHGHNRGDGEKQHENGHGDHQDKHHEEHQGKGSLNWNLGGQVILAEGEQALATYSPQVQAAEAKLSADLAAAGQVQSSMPNPGSVSSLSSQGQALVQQMTSLVQQITSTQDTKQLMSILRQIEKVAEQLRENHRSVIAHPVTLQRDIGSVRVRGTNAVRQYDRAYWNLKYMLSELRGRFRLSGEEVGKARAAVTQYIHASQWALGVFARLDAQLTGQLPLPPTGTPAPGGTVSPAASSVVVPNSTVQAGQTLTVEGTVVSTAGSPVAGAGVSVSFDGVTTNATTGANGSFQATLQPTVAVSGAPVSVSVGGVAIGSATASVTPGAAASIASSVYSPVTVSANSGMTVVYTVKDQYGNPVPGATVDFSLAQGAGPSPESVQEPSEAPGTLSATSGVSNAQGQVSVTYTASATADGDQDAQDTVTASVYSSGQPSTLATNGQAQFQY